MKQSVILQESVISVIPAQPSDELVCLSLLSVCPANLNMTHLFLKQIEGISPILIFNIKQILRFSPVFSLCILNFWTISLCTLVYKTETGYSSYLLAEINFCRLHNKKPQKTPNTLYYHGIMVVYLKKKITVSFVQGIFTGE